MDEHDMIPPARPATEVAPPSAGPEPPAPEPAGPLPVPVAGPVAGWRADLRRPVSWQMFALCIAYVLYVYYWSWITLQRFYSLNAYVYDLGSNMELMWSYWHSSFSAIQTVAQVFDTGIQYLLSPLALPGSYPLLLVFQSVFVGISCFAVYGIARLALGDRTESLLLAASYLIFFPLAGANWLDFEFLGLFAPLFLFGYLAFQRRSYPAAFVLLALCGLIRFPFAIFPLLFGVILVVDSWVRRDTPGPDEPARRRFGWALAALAGVFLLFGYFISLPVTYSGQLALNLHATGGGPPVSTFDLLLTLVLVLAPLLFLPLFSRWVIFLLPYTGLLFLTQYWAYSYPYAFRWEYAPTLVPFVYLGLIDCLAHPGLLFGENALGRSRIAATLRAHWRSRYRFRVTVSVVAIVALLALVYQPYGPFNSGSFNDFGLGQNTAVNETQWSDLTALIHLIPGNDPYVLFQDNMPEVLPRPQAYSTMMVPGLGTFGWPITAAEATAGRFPMVQNGSWTSVRIDYVISDPYSWTFTYGEPSMADFAQALYSSGAYGIVGEADGMLLLEHGYTGMPTYFAPYYAVVLPSDLYAPYGGPSLVGGNVSSTNSGGDDPLWNGPYSALVPGVYSATLELDTTNDSPENAVQIQVLAGPQATDVLVLQALTGANFSATGRWENFTVEFYVNAPLNYVQVIARSLGWAGTLSLRWISIRQIEEGEPTFRAGISADDNEVYQLLDSLPSGTSLVVQAPFAGGIIGRPVWTPQNYSPSDDATYLLGDPFATGFGCGACTNDSAMAPLLNASLANGSYGVLDEADGVTLLERGYHGPPSDFEPLDLSFAPSDLFNVTGEVGVRGTLLSASNTSGNVPLWNGPYSFLVPGDYELTFRMQTSTDAASNRLLLQVLAGPTAETVIAQQWISGSNFSAPDAWQSITVNFTAVGVYNFVQFLARSWSWPGTIELSAIELAETGLPG